MVGMAWTGVAVGSRRRVSRRAVTDLPEFWDPAAHFSAQALFWLQHMRVTVQLVLGLAPLAITMALLWKAKEVILDSVFGARG